MNNLCTRCRCPGCFPPTMTPIYIKGSRANTSFSTSYEPGVMNGSVECQAASAGPRTSQILLYSTMVILEQTSRTPCPMSSTESISSGIFSSSSDNTRETIPGVSFRNYCTFSPKSVRSQGCSLVLSSRRRHSTERERTE